MLLCLRAELVDLTNPKLMGSWTFVYWQREGFYGSSSWQSLMVARVYETRLWQGLGPQPVSPAPPTF